MPVPAAAGHLVPRSEIWWVGPIPETKSVCTTTIPLVSFECCNLFRGRAEDENRPSSSLADTEYRMHVNCLSEANPDDWARCARQAIKNGTGAGDPGQHRFTTWCNTDAKILPSYYSDQRGKPSGAPGAPGLANAGTLAALAAVALGVLAAC